MFINQYFLWFLGHMIKTCSKFFDTPYIRISLVFLKVHCTLKYVSILGNKTFAFV